jgi:hypothetical protein
MDIHDLHATILRLFGLDHTRLTIKFQGRDFRLEDVPRRVIDKVIAWSLRAVLICRVNAHEKIHGIIG